MNDTTNKDIIQRVAQVELEIAVLDNKLNMLATDLKRVNDKAEKVGDKADKIVEGLGELRTALQVVNTRVIMVPAVISGIYVALQVIKSMNIV
jgi:hypothetical protein